MREDVAMEHFEHEGHRLAYTSFGDGPRTVVLIHGLLFSQKLLHPLARELAGRGERVVTLDLLGHGASDRPVPMQDYSMTGYGEQVIGLLDHLGVEEAVVGGLSLGANTSLEAAALAPERIRGLVIEMPVLDNALLGCAVAFTPLMLALTFGAPVMKGIQAVARRVPTPHVGRAGWMADVLLDLVRQDPKPSASLLQGLFFGRVAPPKAERRTLSMPALVIGHQRDPVHPFSDSDALVDEMPDARLVQASWIGELLVSPERLTCEISEFLDRVWKPRRAPRARRVA
jgi:pimeloyl-ACP methyl ester carboxylesterase